MTPEAFAMERLRDDPNLTFEATRQAAEQVGIVIQPIQYGRARRQLGLIGSQPPDHSEAEPIAESTVELPSPEPAPAVTPTPEADKPKKPAFEFLVASLRTEPDLSYRELRSRADQRGLKIAPIMYGRAKALLGLVPVRPRGQGKNRTAAAKLKESGAQITAGPAPPDQLSRQLENVRNTDDLVKIVKHLDGERRRLRGLLERIANSIDEALDYADAPN